MMHRLTEQQQEAARMLATGSRPVDVARVLKVDPSTVSAWKRKKAFREAVRLLTASANEKAIEDARMVRHLTFETAAEGVLLARERLRNGQVEDHNLSSLITACKGFYQVLSGQTGLVETTRQEVGITVSPEEEAVSAEGTLARLRKRSQE